MAKATVTPATLKIQDWTTLRLYPLWIYEGEPRMRVAGPDWQTTTQFYYLERGSVTVTTDHGRATAAAGSWMISTSLKREHRFSEDARMISVNMKVHWADDRPLYPDDPPLAVRGSAYPRLGKAARTLLRLIGGFPGSPQLLEAMRRPATLSGYVRIREATHALVLAYASAMEDAGRLPNPAVVGDPRAADAQRVLDTHRLTWWVDHKQLAKGLGLSESHLSRLFVEQFGVTPHQYELRRRVMRAQELVSASTLPVKQVAYLLGFRQPSHFTAWFRKHAGSSPRRYRKTATRYDVAGPKVRG